MTSRRELHPRRGPHDPARGTPARRPNSVRRTTTHDSLRPEGLLGEVVVVARGRDLRTAGDGSASTIGEARLEARVAFVPDRRLLSIEVEPEARLEDLVGGRTSSGFRKAVDAALPQEHQPRSLRYQLLDDLPTAVLVSGYSMSAGGVHPPRGMFNLQSRADICAGWATGATILVEGAELGYPPVVTGPVAPALDGAGDDDAWHELEKLPPHGMRRWRRLDVWEESGLASVECFFRDSHVDGESLETVLHEYTVTATVDPSSSTFISCEARVGALPWLECPLAAASATGLVGTPAGDLRTRVRDSFIGPSTCTHLNDTLRSLASVPYLASLVA